MYLPPYFFCHNIIFSKDIVLCTMSATQYFLKKMCCGKFVTTHYFLSHNTLFFSKNIVLLKWRTTLFSEKIMCCGKFVTAHYFFEPQHNIFWKNNVLWQKKIRWQIHATIGVDLLQQPPHRRNTAAGVKQPLTHWPPPSTCPHNNGPASHIKLI